MSTSIDINQPITKAFIKTLTSYKFASSLFEEMTFGRQRAIMTIAAIVAPNTYLSYDSVINFTDQLTKEQGH